MKTFLPDKVYDAMKWVAQFLLPGFATLYFALSKLWPLPLPEEVVGSIVAVNVFLGALLGLSTLQYNAAKKIADRQLSYLSEEVYPVTIPNGLLGMSSKTYEVMKWVMLIFLPSSGALYFALSQIWTFPYGQEIVGTIAAITAFAGLFLGISTTQYKEANK